MLGDAHIEQFLDECYAAGIKRPDLFMIAKMPQLFGWLKGAFPRGILPTDIDGEVEINGWFLRMEFKHEGALRRGRIPKGQKMALSRLIDTGRFTVLLIGTNDRSEPVCFESWHRLGKVCPLKDCCAADVYEFCKQWAAFAERGTP